MQKLAIVCLIAMIAVACADTNAQQPAPLSPTVLQNGVTLSDSIPTGPYSTSLWVKSYKFWVPESAGGVNITFNVPDDSCTYVQFLARTGQAPCNPENTDDSDNHYLCDLVLNPDDGVYKGDTYTDVLFHSEQDELFEFVAGGWWYFAVGRYYEDDNDTVCTYNLNVAVAYNCSAGQVGAVESTSNYPPTCVTYKELNSSNINQQQTLNGNTQEFVVYKIDVPSYYMSSISIKVNATTDGLYVRGLSYSVPSESHYECSTGSCSGDSGSYCVYTIECDAPRKGAFYVVLQDFYDDVVNYNATVDFSWVNCNDSFVGEGCAYSAIPVSPFTVVSIPFTQTADWQYFYFDFGDYGSNVTQIALGAATTGASDAEMYVRLNGFPEEDVYETGYEYYDLDTGFVFTPFDFVQAGRWYLGFYCESTPCTYTLSANNTGVPAGTTTTSGSASTTTTTTTSTGATSLTTTTTTTGAASSLSVFLSLIVACAFFATL